MFVMIAEAITGVVVDTFLLAGEARDGFRAAIRDWRFANVTVWEIDPSGDNAPKCVARMDDLAFGEW